MAQQKAQFRDALKQFVQEVEGCDISALTEIRRSDALTLAYLQKIFNQRNPGLFPTEIEDLRVNIVDGSGDRGADFIFRSDTQVYIFQSKYRKSDASESEPDFDHFRSVLKRLCPETGSAHKKNQKVLDLIADIDWENDSFSLYYLSLAKPNINIQHSADAGVDDVPNSALRDISDRCALEYLSEVELNEQYREVMRSATGDIPAVEILLSPMSDDAQATVLELDRGDGRRCFSGALAAGQVHQMYQKHKGTLFNLNIRNYVGDTRTNKDIMETAISEPENFYYYNNGISGIARKVIVDKSNGKTILRCTDFSIINGAQTFRSLSKAHAKNKAATANLLVPLRVTEFDFAKGKTDTFLEKITKYNNTQNAIKISDFRSNDPVQTSITNYVADMSAYEGKKYSYRSKRSQTVDRSKIFIGLDDFCRTIHAFKFAPADIYGGTSYLYDTSAKGGYTKLFGDPREPLSETVFREYFGIWLVCAKVRELLKITAAQRATKFETESDEDERGLLTLEKNAMERRFHVFYALGEVVREHCKLSEKSDVALIATYSRPQWQSDQKKILVIDSAFEVASNSLVQAYQLASSAPDFMHRNFFRNEDFKTFLRKAFLTRRAQISALSL